MKINTKLLKTCPLFYGIAEEDFNQLFTCLNAKEIHVEKGETIFNFSDRPDFFGIVLDGNVHVVQQDYWGNRTILASIMPGELFAEAFAIAEASSLPVSVIAQKDSIILLIDAKQLHSSSHSACLFHTQLIRNLMKILARKNMLLTEKIEHITKKTTREKVLSYLSKCAIEKGSNTFTIPFNREELADYLSVERSALSNTLCKMRDEGLIDFNKNHFSIFNNS